MASRFGVVLVATLLVAVLLGSEALVRDSVIDVQLTGRYTWQLLFDIDNRENSGMIKREVEVISSVSTSYKDMVRSLETSSTSTSTGVNLGGTLFEILNIGVKGEINHEVKSEYEKTSETKEDYSKTTRKTDTYEVGPHSRLLLYRLVFNGPGISYVTDTLSSTPHDMSDVVIDFRVKQTYVLQDINVVYTSDSVSRPSDVLTEARGGNPDVNSGFGGKYVWLVPVWTKNVKEGATGIQIAVQSESNPNYDDLASGAGGLYRYIKMLQDPHSDRRITALTLFRSSSSGDNPVASGNWMKMSEDINRDRKGDYLWLAWNEQVAQVRK